MNTPALSARSKERSGPAHIKKKRGCPQRQPLFVFVLLGSPPIVLALPLYNARFARLAFRLALRRWRRIVLFRWLGPRRLAACRGRIVPDRFTAGRRRIVSPLPDGLVAPLPLRLRPYRVLRRVVPRFRRLDVNGFRPNRVNAAGFCVSRAAFRPHRCVVRYAPNRLADDRAGLSRFDVPRPSRFRPDRIAVAVYFRVLKNTVHRPVVRVTGSGPG